MNRISGTLIKLSSVAALALGSVAVTSAGFATSAPTVTAVENLQAQTAHHAMMAADYRARMRTDEKHAIIWFTQANHCDQKAEQLRVASRQADGQSSSQRDTAVL
jgi:parvulin-like peptidyl-prolyl isomerase